MVKYSCHRCGKDFSNKSQYNSHNQRKTPCKQVDSDRMTIDETTNATHTNIMEEFKIQKPFLKWVGGKTQIIDNIMQKIPSEMNNYHELFLGGGSVLFAVLTLQKHKRTQINGRIYAYDINDRLINVYKNIQQNKDVLFEYISNYVTEYDSITGSIVNRKPTTIEEAKTSKESYYYWIRNKFNTIDRTSVECSALFMFLNKTGFRGMYREGPNGYNVPYGHYKQTPTIINKLELDYISELIKDVVFVQSDFSSSIQNVTEGDFVYLDPPYAPENNKSFVGYTSDGFNLETHNRLFDAITKLHAKNIKFVLSNAKVDLVLKKFEGYPIDEIVARRAINSKDPSATTTEVIVYN